MSEIGTRGHRQSRLLPAFLLLLLAESDRYGGELVEALEETLAASWPVDRGAVYRVLRDLEAAGQVASHWQPAPGGPPRRVYRLLPAGREALAEWNRDINLRRRNLSRFSVRYRRLVRREGNEPVTAGSPAKRERT